MKQVTILGLDDAAATTISAPYDIFSLAGVLWNSGQRQDPIPEFQVEIVSPKGDPVRCMNNMVIMPHRSMTEVDDSHLVIVSAVLDINKTLDNQGEIIGWLQERYKAGSMIAAVCTGSFALAETGLLDGKVATTHWRTIDEFRSLYPKVNLTPERLITDAGDLFCSGGFHSALDLPNYLVEKICGPAISIQCAKALVGERPNTPVVPNSAFDFQRNHADKPIHKIQRFFEKKYQEDIDLDQVAQQYGLGRRTMDRRFKIATGDSPLVYLQRVRVEEAKRRLESTGETFEEICFQVGYEDTTFFRKIFIKHANMRPSEYKAKFVRHGAKRLDLRCSAHCGDEPMTYSDSEQQESLNRPNLGFNPRP